MSNLVVKFLFLRLQGFEESHIATLSTIRARQKEQMHQGTGFTFLDRDTADTNVTIRCQIQIEARSQNELGFQGLVLRQGEAVLTTAIALPHAI